MTTDYGELTITYPVMEGVTRQVTIPIHVQHFCDESRNRPDDWWDDVRACLLDAVQQIEADRC